MDRSFLITNDNGLARYIFISILIAMFLFSIMLLFFMYNDKATNTIMFFCIIFSLLLFFRNCYYSRKIIVDCNNKELHIIGTPLKLYSKHFPFVAIKSILFFEKKEMVADYGEHWQKSIRIIGMQNDTLYESKVSRIVNYPLLVEICNKYFCVDYVVDKSPD